jgi:hypothetical protein
MSIPTCSRSVSSAQPDHVMSASVGLVGSESECGSSTEHIMNMNRELRQ